MNTIDELLASLGGGTLTLTAGHAALAADQVVAHDNCSDLTDVDFTICTRTRRADFRVLHGSDPLDIVDVTAQTPHNTNPFHPDYVKYLKAKWVDEWPVRVGNPTGVSIHHTLSHSWLDTAKYICFTKGYPRTQYHYWVSQDTGCPIYLCLSPIYAPYHDHCGVSPNISIGMAGHLHLYRPPSTQLWQTVRLVKLLMDTYHLEVKDVQGHNDRAGYPRVTVCPGWYADVHTGSNADVGSGTWRQDFDAALRACVDGREWGGY